MQHAGGKEMKMTIWAFTSKTAYDANEFQAN